jgi:hypothetical protein
MVISGRFRNPLVSQGNRLSATNSYRNLIPPEEKRNPALMALGQNHPLVQPPISSTSHLGA